MVRVAGVGRCEHPSSLRQEGQRRRRNPCCVQRHGQRFSAVRAQRDGPGGNQVAGPGDRCREERRLAVSEGHRGDGQRGCGCHRQHGLCDRERVAGEKIAVADIGGGEHLLPCRQAGGGQGHSPASVEGGCHQRPGDTGECQLARRCKQPGGCDPGCQGDHSPVQNWGGWLGQLCLCAGPPHLLEERVGGAGQEAGIPAVGGPHPCAAYGQAVQGGRGNPAFVQGTGAQQRPAGRGEQKCAAGGRARSGRNRGDRCGKQGSCAVGRRVGAAFQQGLCAGLGDSVEDGCRDRSGRVGVPAVGRGEHRAAHCQVGECHGQAAVGCTDSSGQETARTQGERQRARRCNRTGGAQCGSHGDLFPRNRRRWVAGQGDPRGRQRHLLCDRQRTAGQVVAVSAVARRQDARAGGQRWRRGCRNPPSSHRRRVEGPQVGGECHTPCRCQQPWACNRRRKEHGPAVAGRRRCTPQPERRADPLYPLGGSHRPDRQIVGAAAIGGGDHLGASQQAGRADRRHPVGVQRRRPKRTRCRRKGDNPGRNPSPFQGGCHRRGQHDGRAIKRRRRASQLDGGRAGLIGEAEDSRHSHPARGHGDPIAAGQQIGPDGCAAHPAAVASHGVGRGCRQPRPAGRRRDCEHGPWPDRFSRAGEGDGQRFGKELADPCTLPAPAADRERESLRLVGPDVDLGLDWPGQAAQVVGRGTAVAASVDRRAASQQPQVAAGSVRKQWVPVEVAHPGAEGGAAVAAALPPLHDAELDRRLGRRGTCGQIELRPAGGRCVAPQDGVGQLWAARLQQIERPSGRRAVGCKCHLAERWAAVAVGPVVVDRPPGIGAVGIKNRVDQCRAAAALQPMVVDRPP